MLFVDNTAGVGYSFASREIDIFTNDDQFSKDAMSFVTQFFEDWPELITNPLYITGRSYGGIYAPYLTWMIHLHNLRMANLDPVSNKGSFNLKGYVVTNGITDFNFDGYIP